MEKHLVRLFSELKRQCPSMVASIESELGSSHMRHATDVLAVLYFLQNREIHAVAMAVNPGFTLKERELHWIGIGGPDAFFRNVSCFHPELFRDSLYLAWNAFQGLLFASHAEQVAWRLGRIPEPRELLDDEWPGRCDRLRRRFGPIFLGNGSTLH